MKRTLSTLSAVIVTAVCLLLAVHHGVLGERARLSLYRLELRGAAIATKSGGVIVLGDSISYMAASPRICGLSSLNASIPGSKLADWRELGPSLVRLADPKIVVLALGTNDARRASLTDSAQWGKDYRALLDALGRRKVILVEPTKIELGRSSSGLIDPARIEAIDAMVSRLATAYVVVPSHPTTGATIDGIHPNNIGKAMWRQRLAGACARLS